MMKALLKAACLAVYVLAAAKLAGLLPEDSFNRTPLVAAVLLGLHALELLFAFKHVRRYKGPIAASVLLTLLFGVLHWKPLADAHRNRVEQP